ncbi:hypothetical protein DFH07DRAFT_784790 [Mycena maculata]|uniref:Uncharacterized protein n=1 Tax=Mycena maculata TaxID=230809 RepID=A0AAD7MID4_9AGAR|nr:hypothetical protein DFH07DRAFT_784790 [Mycena maculata]
MRRDGEEREKEEEGAREHNAPENGNRSPRYPRPERSGARFPLGQNTKPAKNAHASKCPASPQSTAPNLKRKRKKERKKKKTHPQPAPTPPQADSAPSSTYTPTPGRSSTPTAAEGPPSLLRPARAGIRVRGAGVTRPGPEDCEAWEWEEDAYDECDVRDADEESDCDGECRGASACCTFA